MLLFLTLIIYLHKEPSTPLKSLDTQKCLTWISIPFYPCFPTLFSFRIILFDVKKKKNLRTWAVLLFKFYLHMLLLHTRRVSLLHYLPEYCKVRSGFCDYEIWKLGFLWKSVSTTVRGPGMSESHIARHPTSLWGNTHSHMILNE